MAVINFPDPSQSPWTNTTTGVTYSYINGAWKVTGGTGGGDASITVGTTPPDPSTVQEGALWWNSSSDDATLYVLYVDVTNGRRGGNFWSNKLLQRQRPT